MTTRREQIVNKYLELEIELKSLIDVSILPSLHEIDLCDSIYLITYMFVGIESDDQYKSKIDDLIKTNNIDIKKDKDKLYTLITDFIRWLKMV